MKYRKKPVVIEAVQYFGDMGCFTGEIPVWLNKACSLSDVFTRGNRTFIRTREGVMEVSDGDWIIRGILGELYPCKPDVFAATYEPVEDECKSH